MGFAAAFVLGYVGLGLTSGFATPNSGVEGVTLAAIAAFTLVSLFVTWGAGMVLAWRTRSVIWMLIACVPPPFGALLCALLAPAPSGPAGAAPPGRGMLR